MWERHLWIPTGMPDSLNGRMHRKMFVIQDGDSLLERACTAREIDARRQYNHQLESGA